ncbi:hypothetical protein Rhe02_85790 [Rhizocola hellebori]|uniref:VWFA domain-containing protein n=2 Tax=Rhizocola hellebori TaxID=1392758 RepID=A0A8J3VLC7_9ACTN|nr:hypothetical protein Rhe02_85790 [Rhizocola hellebori]
MLFAAAPAHAVDGNLPGGTSISVAIATPANGAVFPPGPVTVTGTASVGVGVPVANTSLVYVIDVSGSTESFGAPSCGTILQCEIAAALALNNEAQDGSVGEVGAVVFGSVAATADVQPAGGDQLITGPATNNNGNGTRDIEEVIASASTGAVGQFTAKGVDQSTNFEDALAKARTVTDAATKARKIVVFLSDGFATAGGSINGPLTGIPANVDIYTFAVGDGADCNNTGAGQGSLEQITAATVPGGHCVQVTDVGSLPDILPNVIGSSLNTLTMQVDGGAFNPISNTGITPDLPQAGPASVTYSTATAALGAGTHTICVRANGTDGGGAGFVTDCHNIIINAPPVVSPIGPFAGQEGTLVSIGGTVTDPDGPSLVTTWSIAAQSGVDAGATCVITNPAALSTTVKCTDDGVYKLTLTANDSVNTPVSAVTTLTLSNVAPAATISAPAANTLVLRNSNVVFTAPFTDLGTNDSHTCSVNFDDGSPVAPGSVSETPGTGTCTANHAFTAVGPHNVLVTVTDDDGHSGTAIVRVVVYRTAGAFAIQATGLVTIPRTPNVTCLPNAAQTQAAVNLPPLVTTGVLNASCTVDPNNGTTVARSSVDGATLLSGAIRLSVVESTCTSSASGVARSSIVVGTINGAPINAGPATIGIPGVAVVHLNETTTGPGGQLVQNAVRVEVLGLLGIVTQQVILSSCYIN